MTRHGIDKKTKGMTMRHPILAALLSLLPWAVYAAPTWQTISAEPGKRIELDRTSIKRDGNTVQAQGRVVLEKELIDTRSGAGYRVIEAITRYDCGSRNASTLKRIYKKNETQVVREEELQGPDLPVRSGTLDDKVLREVCRPPKDSAAAVAQKANEAGTMLQAANDALLAKETRPAVKPDSIKASETTPKENSPLPSIRPNLKAAMESSRPGPTAATANPPSPVTSTPPPKALPVSHSAPGNISAPVVVAAKGGKTRKSEGYMLELVQRETVMQHAALPWSYDGLGGPEHWHAIDPRNTLCATGQRQSPIDIRDGIRVDLEPIRFNYRPSTFRIADTGHTVRIEVADSTLTLTGKTYELIEFHFHRPSEEKINGQRFDMVAHLVHKADDGQLAIVAVLMERGDENPFIQTLWNNLPLEKGLSVSPPTLAIDPANLLPASRNYYTYMGSDTTPPCSEGVLWLVMKQAVPVSSEQIAIFSRLYRNNARPIQPTNGRLIKEGR